MALLGAACGPPARLASERDPPARLEQPAPSPQLLAPVRPIAPAFQASLPDDQTALSWEIAQSIRAVSGVSAVARMSIGTVTIHSRAGFGDVTLASIEPFEFRPLAPVVTAEADFVWRGLAGREIFLAHEEHRQLGIQAGFHVLVKGPASEIPMRVGGIASNGSPNWAGALASQSNGALLGMASPSLILVGLEPEANAESVRKQLQQRLPTVRFDETAASSRRAFVSGVAASRLFGSFDFIVNEDGSIFPNADWVRRYITKRSVPILGEVVCHRVMFPQLIGVLSEIEKEGLGGTIDVPDYHYQGGCFNPRLIRGDNPRRPLSMHAWGLAVDINVARNPAGQRSQQDPRMVAIFERWGFRWGGRWSPPDAHHFELAAVLKS